MWESPQRNSCTYLTKQSNRANCISYLELLINPATKLFKKTFQLTVFMDVYHNSRLYRRTTPLIINLTNKISQLEFLPAKQIWQIYPENYLKYVAAPLSGLFKARRHPKMTQKKRLSSFKTVPHSETASHIFNGPSIEK